MITNYEYGPWKVGVDIERTKEYHQSITSNLDVNLKTILTAEQVEFFESFGIDLTKVEVHHNKRVEDEEETIFSDVYSIRAMLCGDLYSISREQEELYFEEDDTDEESLFVEGERENVVVSDSGSLFDTGYSGMIIAFSHPVMYRALQAENNELDEKYRKWFCGEVFVKAIVNNK
ncbi:hypothetical protein P261_02661 [Lachnospiraceae bacterium TWA4]|nr:hypothetical protein P261_02661 [Lachnospiraceae bacterium TWA4]